MLHVPDLAANAITSVTDNPYIIALLIDLIILVYYAFTDANGAFTLDNLTSISGYGSVDVYKRQVLCSSTDGLTA